MAHRLQATQYSSSKAIGPYNTTIKESSASAAKQSVVEN